MSFDKTKGTPQLKQKQDAEITSIRSWQAALRPLLDQAAALDNVDLLNALLNLWARKCLRETAVSDGR